MIYTIRAGRTYLAVIARDHRRQLQRDSDNPRPRVSRNLMNFSVTFVTVPYELLK